MGGGLAGSFDLFDHEIRQALSALPDPPAVMPSVIGGDAVVIGGLIAADADTRNGCSASPTAPEPATSKPAVIRQARSNHLPVGKLAVTLSHLSVW